MEFEPIGTGSLAALGVGTALAFLLPLALALLWTFLKKERFTTVLVGAATFLVFVLLLEKPIQSLVLSQNLSLGRFLHERPALFALVTALFAGVFEETGRLVAFSTLLKNRKNRETAISHGIGHGGMEVMLILGATYATYLVYAFMINSGTFGAIVDQVAKQAPEQVETLRKLGSLLANITLADVGMALLERVSAVLFHIGASMLVFYACKDKKKLWLYPLAILLHTAMDSIAALVSVGVLILPLLAVEAIFAVFGLLTFLCAYGFLYRKDAQKPASDGLTS